MLETPRNVSNKLGLVERYLHCTYPTGMKLRNMRRTRERKALKHMLPGVMFEFRLQFRSFCPGAHPAESNHSHSSVLLPQHQPLSEGTIVLISPGQLILFIWEMACFLASFSCLRTAPNKASSHQSPSQAVGEDVRAHVETTPAATFWAATNEPLNRPSTKYCRALRFILRAPLWRSLPQTHQDLLQD